MSYKPFVLGIGHTGRRLVRYLGCEGRSRSTIPAFNWLDPDTYFENSNLNIVLTFALNEGSESEFLRFKSWLLKANQLIVFSSIGGLTSEGVLDENAALKNEIRYLREEELRKQGALVLHLAGIYDSERNPIDWLKKNLISKHKRGVHLIHSRDICKMVEHFLKNPLRGERLLVSDGKEHLWSDIERMAKENSWLDPNFTRPDKEIKRKDKELSLGKLRSLLYGDFKFMPLDEGLRDTGE